MCPDGVGLVSSLLLVVRGNASTVCDGAVCFHLVHSLLRAVTPLEHGCVVVLALVLRRSEGPPSDRA